MIDLKVRRIPFDFEGVDFIWNKNRLVLEKEALKQNLMKVISKPIKKLETEGGEAATGADD